MPWIMQHRLAPHLQNTIAGEIPPDIDVPRAIPNRQKMHVEITLPEYQAVRLATS